MIVVNFKTYREAMGYKAVTLARVCQSVYQKTKVRIVAVPQVADLRVCVETGVECWVQNVDTTELGKKTGWITVEDAEEAGARGTLLNHSEHKSPLEMVQKIAEMIYPMTFELCICASDVEEAAEVARYMPNYVAYEPPDLIGSTNKSVSSERPDEIARVVKAVNFPVLVGAGIHSAQDVKTGLKIGAKGVLVATDVVLANDQEKALTELAMAFLEEPGK